MIPCAHSTPLWNGPSTGHLLFLEPFPPAVVLERDIHTRKGGCGEGSVRALSFLL